MRIDEALKIVGLEGQRRRLVLTLSGGQQRRLALAKAFITKSKVLLMDEPTSGLDPVAKSEVWEHMRKLRDMGTTIFMSTHDTREAESLGDRVGMMNAGRMMTIGSVQELKNIVKGRDVIEIIGKGITYKIELLKQLGLIREVKVISRTERATPPIKVIAYAGGKLPQEYESLKEDPYTVLVEVPLELALGSREKLEEYVRNIVEKRKMELAKCTEDEKVRLYVDSAEETVPKVLDVLFKEGVSVSSVHIKPITLEDVFLTIVGKLIVG